MPIPRNELPANLDPSKPYQLPDNLAESAEPTSQPDDRQRYSLTICNTSGTTSHVIQSLTVRIAAFSAYNGPLNTYMFCDRIYQRPYGVAGGGCGGGHVRSMSSSRRALRRTRRRGRR